jgi:hypothetical protein
VQAGTISIIVSRQYHSTINRNRKGMIMGSQPNSYARVIAKAWSDATFAQRLTSDPKGALKDEGWNIPDGVGVEVKLDSDANSFVLGIPRKPPGLKDEQLREAANAIPCCTKPCAEYAVVCC